MIVNCKTIQAHLEVCFQSAVRKYEKARTLEEKEKYEKELHYFAQRLKEHGKEVRHRSIHKLYFRK